MINLNQNEAFIKLLDNLNDYESVGLGNCNSKILFVGKVAGINIEYSEDLLSIREKLKNLHGSGSVKQWKSNEFDYSENPVNLNELSDTWQNYQLLYGKIFEEKRNS